MTYKNGIKVFVYILAALLTTVYLVVHLQHSFHAFRNTIKQFFGSEYIDWSNFDYKRELTKLNEAKVSADNRMLVDIIKRYYIEPPSDLPYNLKYPEVKDPSQGQASIVDRALNYKKDGFYIECGAHDGEYVSNTLFFERHRNWSGILIEANPTRYRQLKEKHRKAFTLNACLSLSPYPTKVTFGLEKIVKENSKMEEEEHTVVQCFPLYSVLLALDMVKADYFSLDVEGAEKGILDTVPWDKVDMKLMSVEYNSWVGGKDRLLDYMRRRGYTNISEINEHYAADVILLKQ